MQVRAVRSRGMAMKAGLARVSTLMMMATPLFTSSCRSPETEGQRVVFEALETRLLQAQLVRVSFHVVAEGVITADLKGDLSVEQGHRIRLRAKGQFAGKEADVFLDADESEMELGNGQRREKEDVPGELREAFLLGWTRMGILHNLARLTQCAVPDHAAGGVKQWVVLDAFGAESSTNGAVSFRITVAGRPSGSATLEIGTSGYPLERHQQVHFPSGTMTVVEQYSDVRIEP